MQKEYENELKEKDRIIEEYKKQIALLKTQLDHYKKMASIDPLTNLNNRRSLSYASSYTSIIMGDIDYFKKINDKYGHEIGDKVLIEIGNILRSNIRENDLACRWGGEEFAIFLNNCGEDIAYEKAKILRTKVEKLEDIFGFYITMSFGVSSIDTTVPDAIKKADMAMYESKEKGRNRVTVYSLKPTN